VTTVWYSIVLHDSQSLVVEAGKYSRPTRRRLSTKSLVPRVDLTSKSQHLVVRRRLWRRQREAACAVVVGGWMKRWTDIVLGAMRVKTRRQAVVVTSRVDGSKPTVGTRRRW